MTIVPAIKFENNASLVIAVLRQRSKRIKTNIDLILEEQTNWIIENKMQANFDKNKFEWQFTEEEHAVMFKLRFGI